MKNQGIDSFEVEEWQLALNQIGEGYALFDDGSLHMVFLFADKEEVVIHKTIF